MKTPTDKESSSSAVVVHPVNKTFSLKDSQCTIAKSCVFDENLLGFNWFKYIFYTFCLVTSKQLYFRKPDPISHGQWPRESFFQKFKTFGLGQTN